MGLRGPHLPAIRPEIMGGESPHPSMFCLSALFAASADFA